MYEFKLYIVGQTQKSLDMIQALGSLMEERFKGLYSFEVIDLLTNPEAAESDDIITSPALLKANPSPARKVIGDLFNLEKVMEGLDLTSKTESILKENGNMFDFLKHRVFPFVRKRRKEVGFETEKRADRENSEKKYFDLQESTAKCQVSSSFNRQ